MRGRAAARFGQGSMPGAAPRAHACKGNAVVPASKATGHCICVAESVSTCSWRTTTLQSERAVETAPEGCSHKTDLRRLRRERFGVGTDWGSARFQSKVARASGEWLCPKRSALPGIDGGKLSAAVNIAVFAALRLRIGVPPPASPISRAFAAIVGGNGVAKTAKMATGSARIGKVGGKYRGYYCAIWRATGWERRGKPREQWKVVRRHRCDLL
jgi:hypothetical protein